MCTASETTFLPIEAMKIVPWPHHDDSWALVNRRGDVLANGDYAHCLRRLERISDPSL